MRRVGLAEARDNLSNLVNEAAHGKQRIVIESRGRPKAAIIGLDDLERLDQVADAGRVARRPMLRWLEDTEKMLRGQPAIAGSTLAALREVREGQVAEVRRHQGRSPTRRRR